MFLVCIPQVVFVNLNQSRKVMLFFDLMNCDPELWNVILAYALHFIFCFFFLLPSLPPFLLVFPLPFLLVFLSYFTTFLSFVFLPLLSFYFSSSPFFFYSVSLFKIQLSAKYAFNHQLLLHLGHFWFAASMNTYTPQKQPEIFICFLNGPETFFYGMAIDNMFL